MLAGRVDEHKYILGAIQVHSYKWFWLLMKDITEHMNFKQNVDICIDFEVLPGYHGIHIQIMPLNVY